MAPKLNGAVDPVFRPTDSTWKAPPKSTAVENPFALSPSYSSVPEIQHFEYDPSRHVSDSSSYIKQGASKTYSIAIRIGDAVLTLAPIVFIVFAFRASAIDGHPISSGGEAVVQAAKINPTIFPIVFAAVVGRLMRTFALWKAERGCELGVLEQLVGSQNLLATIDRVFLLHNFGGVGIGVVVLWALSPLGGQSSLRTLSTRQSVFIDHQPIYYLDYNTTYSSFGTGSGLEYSTSGMTALYRACLLAPDCVQTSPTDLWNNPKVPVLECLPDYHADDPANTWYTVPLSNDTIYSSSTGIILAGLPKDRFSNFSIETSYMNAQCSEPVSFGTDSSNNGFDNFRDWLGDLGFDKNKSENMFGWTGVNQNNSRGNSFLVDTNWNFMEDEPPPSINLIYASQGESMTQDKYIYAFNCSLTATNLEAAISCQNQYCRVQRIRRSMVDTRSPNITPFHTQGPMIMNNFLTWFPFAAGQMHSAEISPTDYYLMGSDSPYGFNQNKTDYEGVTGKEFSQRFSTLLNTVWQISVGRTAIATAAVTDLNIVISGQAGYTAANTTAETLSYVMVYHTHKIWVALTAIISIILLFCGFAGVAFKYGTKAPDILGYVSTMTRDNPYFNGPAVADSVGGLERARLLRHVKVQLADVKPYEESGHIALRTIRSGSIQ